MTTTSYVSHLEEGLQLISSLLSRVSDEAWTRDQNGKWTIAQEVAHILKANQRTAQLFSSAARSLWHPNNRPSRSYDTIGNEYENGLAAIGSLTNAPSAPDDNANQVDSATQLAQWQSMTELLLRNVAALSEDDLDNFTVWKHPILGPVTTREMVSFTDYHTRHHAAILFRKLGEN